MSIKNFTEYNLPQNAYATFDATSLKSLIIQRLNESEVFRDQNFEGSNINAFIDVVAYMYHTLLFYLNTTSSESTFTTAELYENMNKLVSNLGYKPLGKQTSVANISLVGTSNLSIGPYSIRKFSYVNISGVNYTTLKDISFEKTIAGEQSLSISNSILHQGSIKEHLPYTATGEEFEVVKVVNTRPATNSITEPFISDNTFTVYVKSYDTGTWQQWTESASLYLESPGSLKYAKRLNENGNYVIFNLLKTEKKELVEKRLKELAERYDEDIYWAINRVEDILISRSFNGGVFGDETAIMEGYDWLRGDEIEGLAF